MNAAFLKRCLRAIWNNPARWDQRFWVNSGAACGTTFCLAGWAWVLHHQVPMDELDLVDRDSGSVEIPELAAQLFNFDEQQVLDLFYNAAWSHTGILRAHQFRGQVPDFKEAFAAFCAAVEQSTGVRFDPEEDGCD